MQDLMEKLQGILSTKEGQEQLNNVAQMLGMNSQGASGQSEAKKAPETSTSANGGDTMSMVQELLSKLQSPNEQQSVSENSPIDMGMILKLQQVFQGMNTNDKNSQLLLALKPHFGEARQHKVEQAMSMMRLMAMLPMLKESGLFFGL